MKIIIEIKNLKNLTRVLDLLKPTKLLSDIQVWKKEDALTVVPNSEIPVDYREFWNCIEPKMGIEAIDRQIAEMR